MENSIVARFARLRRKDRRQAEYGSVISHEAGQFWNSPWRMTGLLVVAGGCLAMHGCVNFTAPARKHSLENGVVWIDYDSSRRGAFLVPAGAEGKFKFCSEPVPDVALTLATKISGKLKNSGGEGGADGSATATAIALSGRTQTVLIAREALYRICEASLNRKISDADLLSYFKEVMNSINTIANADVARASADASKAAAKLKVVDGLNSKAIKNDEAVEMLKAIDK
ncbi:hypothetical protein [Frateuria sp. Soil773]|uniref:hypothetical protein n=1 Tax=Frateuria sp. Soil773 TaxID=1736407 RepID=UPI0012F7FDE3|nr:hypothetical protein [Frateuria sp. Soil773]